MHLWPCMWINYDHLWWKNEPEHYNICMLSSSTCLNKWSLCCLQLGWFDCGRASVIQANFLITFPYFPNHPLIIFHFFSIPSDLFPITLKSHYNLFLINIRSSPIISLLLFSISSDLFPITFQLSFEHTLILRLVSDPLQITSELFPITFYSLSNLLSSYFLFTKGIEKRLLVNLSILSGFIAKNPLPQFALEDWDRKSVV